MTVDGGPTGVAYYGGKGFRVTAGGSVRSRALRLRVRGREAARVDADRADGLVDAGRGRRRRGAREAAVFRGVAIAGDRVYATDFHNARVDVYDSALAAGRVVPARSSTARSPSWYAPFGIQAIGGHLFVTYVCRAPVNGNDAPTGGYVDEFDRDGTLVARVARTGALNAPWGIALAPRVVRPLRRRPARRQLRRRPHQRVPPDRGRLGVRRDAARARKAKPLVVNGLWGLAFGNGGTAGPRGHALLRVRPARLARRDRARRARSARLDHARGAAVSRPARRGAA